MKRTLVLIFLFISILLFAQTEVTLWHSYRGNEKEAVMQVVENFNKSHTDVKIKALGIPYDAFPDKITAAIPRGKGPDIFIFAHDRIGGWVEADIIEPIDFYLEEDISGNFVEGAWEPMLYDGSMYGLPMSLKSIILFYNPNIIKSPPKTTDEMIALAHKHTDAANGKYGLVYEIANFYYHACWLQGFGGKIFNDNDIPVLNSAENIRSFQFAQDLFLKEKIVPPEVSNVLVTTLYNEGKAAMVISGPWFRGEIDGVPHEVELLPIISEVGNPAIPFMSSEGIMMSAKSENKDEAFEVMEFLISEEAAFIFATVGNQPVALKSVYEKPQVKNDKYLPKFKAQIENSRPMPSIPQMTSVWSPASTAINAAVNGKDPKEVLDEAQEKVMTTLKAAGYIK
ncbi:MAG: extracellular solute-binding protein [Candidatus Cloacimonetes bacterium]|nr:extracellular solute-binding protein [Candidatus Cloacimonadota bacterium]MCF7814363.1 extracellular solute-binding protein [Candidatus Cloacimonadota bacterium]MCF7868986.1 extracellular solute-binding protein [Candidatus Cloacimonadota bacterium]MCF7884380.1 extracellular solute-binding protein [Candidatus Cloacimonadota bacterium]